MVDQYQSASLLVLFMIGLLGSGHCIGMCGGIATALGLATESPRGGVLVAGYNLGRVSSYGVAGALVASLGYWGAEYLALGPVLRLVAGVILILMGFYLAGWWPVLVKLEKLGARLWRRLQPLGAGLMPVRSFRQAFLLGSLWGWLPCGLVYTALAFAAASASPVDGALLMIAFGAGTAPAMVAGGLFSGALKGFLQAPPVRVLVATAMIAFGAWTFYGVLGHGGGHGIGHGTGAMEHHHHP